MPGGSQQRSDQPLRQSEIGVEAAFLPQSPLHVPSKTALVNAVVLPLFLVWLGGVLVSPALVRLGR